MNLLLLLLSLAGLTGALIFAPGLEPVFHLPAYCVLGAAAALSIFGRVYFSKDTGRCLVVSLAFFGYIVARALTSPAAYLARTDLFMVLAALILYALVAVRLTSTPLRVIFAGALLILAVGNVFIGAIQFFKGHEFMPIPFLPRGDYGSRASGFYGCPNHLAGFLEVMFLITLSFVFWARWNWGWRILAIYFALVCGAGILITGSRGGYLSLATGLATFVGLSLWQAGRKMGKQLTYVVMAAMVAVLAVLGFTVQSLVRSSSDLSFRVESAGVDIPLRVALTKAGLEQFQVNPVLGTGSGTYLFYGRLFRHPQVIGDPVYAHNDYVQLLAEYGAVGGILFGVFLLVHLGNGIFSLRYLAGRSGDYREDFRFDPHIRTHIALTIGALSSVAAYLVHSLVDFNLHIPANALLLAFVFGILANPAGALSVPLPRLQSVRPTAAWAVRILIPAIGLFLIWRAAPTWQAEYYGKKAAEVLEDWRSLESAELAKEAEALAVRALNHDPQNPRLHYYVAEAQIIQAEQSAEQAERERHYAEAILAYRAALALTPMDANLYLGIGSAFDALGQPEEALPNFQKALELDPNSGRTRWAYAAHLHNSGNFAEAEKVYKSALSRGADEAVVLGLQRLEEDMKAAAIEPSRPAPNP